MAGFMFTFVPILLLLLLLSCILPLSLVHAGEIIDDFDMEITTLNMNLSIHWSPPGNVLENETIYYTVVRNPWDEPLYVDGCIDITSTYCSLIDVYPNGGGFQRTEYYYIKLDSTTRDSKTREADFGWRDISISAPVVYNHTTESRSIKVNFHFPKTPFMRNGKPIYMGDSDLGDGLFVTTRYVAVSVIVDNKDDAKREPSSKCNKSLTLQGLGTIQCHGLQPYTNYVLRIRSKLYEFSDDVTSLEFITKTDVPEVAPTITGTDVTRRYCDYRDVTVTWKDNKDYESNGPLTNYFIQFKGDDEDEFDYIDVPPTNKSAVLISLFRWTKYELVVSSANTHGRCASKKGYIEAEFRNPETYKPIIQNVTKLSKRQWALSWIPPREHHSRCIVGYHVITNINDDIEDDFMVDGFNTSTAILHFTQTGQYTIDVITLVNDSVQTEAKATILYSATVTTGKIMEWSIFAGVALLVVVLCSAVAAMIRKVFCDYSNLPDISHSRSMKIARSIRPESTCLKAPPTREHFDPTRMDATNSKFYGDFSLEDDVFQPKSTSTTYLLSTSSSSANEECKINPLRYERRSSAKNEYDKDEFSSPSKIKSDETRSSASPCGIHSKRPGNEPDDSAGYLPHPFTKKHDQLTVTIPGIRSATNISSPSFSSDSGISSMTFTGSVSEFPPPSPLWVDSESSPDVDDKFESPYVITALAVPLGRIQSTSLSSETEDNVYKRLDSRGSTYDPHPKGYLQMNPITPAMEFGRDEINSLQAGHNMYTSSSMSAPYSKLSPNEINGVDFA